MAGPGEGPNDHAGDGGPTFGALLGTPTVVTGASGFIGARLVERLLALGAEVTALVRPGTNLSRLARVLHRLEIVESDLGDPEGLRLLRLPEAPLVFHLAAAGVVSEPLARQQIVETNALGTLRMLQVAQRGGCQRFLYCGSCYEYGGGERCREDAAPEPLTEYGASKAAGWLLAKAFGRQHGIGAVAIRPFNVYGPGEAETRLVPHVIRAALRNRDIVLSAGRQRRDFVYLDDIVEGLIAAALAPDAEGEVFNLCSGRGVAVADLVALALELIGTDQAPVFGARAYRATDAMVLTGDPDKAARRLGWTARTPLRDGLSQTISWHHEQIRGLAGTRRATAGVL